MKPSAITASARPVADRPVLKPAQARAEAARQVLVLLVWAYWALLICEGALRKWVVPGLSDALLIIRDPIAFAAIVVAVSHNRLPSHGSIAATLGLAALAGVSAVLTSQQPFIVTFYGLRANFLHVPLVWVIGANLNREDLLRLGKLTLWVVLPMTLLLSLQFVMPQSSWVNRTVGGAEGGGFSGAGGRFRGSGTFSFTNGLALFYTFAAAWFLALCADSRHLPIWTRLVFGGALLLAIPLSISRTLALGAALCLVAFAGARLLMGRGLGLARVLLALGVGGLVASQTQLFDLAVQAFGARWDNSVTSAEGGFEASILNRFFEGLTGPLRAIFQTDLLGAGVGSGTNVGAKYLTGSMGFTHGEGEWYRLLGESGAIVGGAQIILRVYLAYLALKLSLRALGRGEELALLLWSASAIPFALGQWGQPTSQGFATLGLGLCFAACRKAA